MITIDSTKDLLAEIISWEKDLSQYESLETILRRKYAIQKREFDLVPISSITNDECIEACKIVEPLPFQSPKTSHKWNVDRSKADYIEVTNPLNEYSFQIFFENGDVNVYMSGVLIPTSNQAKLANWYANNGYDCLPNTSQT